MNGIVKEKTMEDRKFNFFMPIDTENSFKKSEASSRGVEEGDWYVSGFASTPDIDLQNDIVRPDAIDIDYFVKNGYLNYEHKNDPEYKIGVPTDNCYVDSRKGLYVEGILFKDNEYAQKMWALAKSLDKAKVGRNLGFSIEGVIRKRNDMDDRIIEDVVIYNVAITTNPANPHATWEAFVKSLTEGQANEASKTMSTGYETDPAKQTGGAVLRPEELAQTISTLTDTIKGKSPEELDQLWKGVGAQLDKDGKNSRENAILMLQLAKGISRNDALAFVDKL